MTSQDALLPVMYDVHRRLHLMRATKAHVMRRGFGKHCRVIAEVGTEQLLKAMALHGESADLRELLRDPQVDVSLKRALGGVLQATSSIIGMEGHRSQIRLRGHAAGWHFGSAHVFVTPNLADIRSPLLLQLHLQRPIATVETCKIDLDWDLEMPGMPTAAAMRRIVATDPVSQARCFALMMDIFFEEVLGILPPLKRESYRVGVHATFEDGVASSLQGGVFGDVAALSGPLETQGRGSLHPHILVALLGHDLGQRLRSIMHRIQHGELLIELSRWSRRVLEAVQRFKYDSQLALGEQLETPQQPLPFNERQRAECGRQYDSCSLVPTEPDGHELRAAAEGSVAAGARVTLTGCYASLRPNYQRREQHALVEAVEWKRKFCEDYRRLVIQNHFHKCTKSCFKKILDAIVCVFRCIFLGWGCCWVLCWELWLLFLCSSGEIWLHLLVRKAVKGKRGCRFGCFHIELIKDDEGKQKTLCRKGWPRVQKAGFSRLQYETEDLAQVEEFKNENPHVFQAQRDHPFEGMSNPVAQVVMRCNVDVKYIGRAFAEEDLMKFNAESLSTEQGSAASSSSQRVTGGLQAEMSERASSDMQGSEEDVALQGRSQLFGVASEAEISEQAAIDTVRSRQDVDSKRRKTSMLSNSSPSEKKMGNMKMALERVLIDMSRDMQDVGFYTGEYAAKKFEISRNMLPELYAGSNYAVSSD